MNKINWGKMRKSFSRPRVLLGTLGVLVVIGIGGLISSHYYLDGGQAEASSIPSTYDKYGFIVNRSRTTGEPRDKGDSCGFMGLQAMNFSLNGQYDKARELYLRCAKIDFYRHPDIYKEAQGQGPTYNGTSFDMMVIWDYVVSKWPQVGNRPSFHTRQSKYWDGRYRAEWMFNPTVIKAELAFRKLSPALEHDYYKNNLLMLKVGVALEKTNNQGLRKSAQEYAKLLEEKTKFDYTYKVNGKTITKKIKVNNDFFRYLVGLPLGAGKVWENRWYPQNNDGNGFVEWTFQRDPRLRNFYREQNKDIWFHTETYNGEKLPLSRQFMKFVRQGGGGDEKLDAEVIEVSNPSVVTPGRTYNILIRLKNLGKKSWSDKDIKLGTYEPADHKSPLYTSGLGTGWQDPSTIKLEESIVKPGKVGTFRAKARLSKKTPPGNCREKFRPFSENTNWFGSPLEINTKVRSVDNYAFIRTRKGIAPSRMRRGQRARIIIRIRNTGNTTWHRGGNWKKQRVIKLAPSHPRYRRSAFRFGRIRMRETTVKPGKIATFVFRIKAPRKRGYYKEYVCPVILGMKWMKDKRIHLRSPSRYGIRVR